MPVKLACRQWLVSILLTLAAGLMIVVGLALPAFAQRPTKSWEVFAEGGASYWNNHYLDSVVEFGNPPRNETLQYTTHVGSSGRAFFGVRFRIDPRESIEGSYSYALADLTESQHCEQVNCGGGWTNSAVRAHFFAINYVRGLRRAGRVRPFLTAGVGLVYLHAVPFHTIFGSIRSGVFEPDPFTVNLGGGVDILISPHWLARVEYRDWLLEGPRLNDYYAYGATGLTHNEVPTVGFAYRF